VLSRTFRIGTPPTKVSNVSSFSDFLKPSQEVNPNEAKKAVTGTRVLDIVPLALQMDCDGYLLWCTTDVPMEHGAVRRINKRKDLAAQAEGSLFSESEP